MHVGVVLDRVASKFHALYFMHKNMHKAQLHGLNGTLPLF